MTSLGRRRSAWHPLRRNVTRGGRRPFLRTRPPFIKEVLYPGITDFYNACAPIYGPIPADFTAVVLSAVRDTAYVPGPTPSSMASRVAQGTNVPSALQQPSFKG